MACDKNCTKKLYDFIYVFSQGENMTFEIFLITFDALFASKIRIQLKSLFSICQ